MVDYNNTLKRNKLEKINIEKVQCVREKYKLIILTGVCRLI